jgi:hypothetical protein
MLSGDFSGGYRNQKTSRRITLLLSESSFTTKGV